MNLHEYFLKNNRNLIHKWIHYFDIYERHFKKFVGKDVLIIEIGVYEGGSIEMWKEYFGENCKVVGIDINPNCKKYENIEKNIYVEIGSQNDKDFLKSIIEKYGKADIIIDDGSHQMLDVVTSFETLYSNVKDDGIYLVEDLQTAYWENYGGGYKKPDTFIEFAKDKIDELNALSSKILNPTEFTLSTQSICIYDSIIVFEKRLQGYRMDIKTSGFEKMQNHLR